MTDEELMRERRQLAQSFRVPRSADIDVTNASAWLRSGTLPTTPRDDPLAGRLLLARRIRAVERFAHRLSHAESFDSPWRYGAQMRRRLLSAAARFLVRAEDAFTIAGTKHTHGLDALEGRQPSSFESDLLEHTIPSDAAYVAWSDTVLAAFAVRVRGLGARSTTTTTKRRRRRREP